MTAVEPARRPAAAVAASGHSRPLTAEAPVGRPTAHWGMYLLVATEATFFACLLASYFYIQFTRGGPWPPAGIEKPKLVKPLIMVGVLLISSVTMVGADRSIRRDRSGRMLLALVITILLGLAFLAVEASDFQEKLTEFTWRTNAYGSLYFVISGFDTLHVISGLVMLGWLVVAGALGKFAAGRHERVRTVSIYWQFIVVLWLVIVFSLHLSPHFSDWF